MTEQAPEAVSEDPQQLLLSVVQHYLKQRLQAEAPSALVTLYWEEFFRVYAPIVSGLVARHVARQEERDDLVQEVWMTVAARLPEFHWRENRGGLRAWLSTLIRNRTIDLIRQKGRRLQPLALEQVHPNHLPPADDDPTARLTKEWQAQALRAILDDLRPQIGEVNYQIVQLHYWGGRTTPDIARQLGMNEGQVSSRLHRVLEKLRRRMGAFFGG